MPSATDALSVGCPRCGSTRDEPCKGTRGYRTAQHRERHQLYTQQQQIDTARFGRSQRRLNQSKYRLTRKRIETAMRVTTGYTGQRGRMKDLVDTLLREKG